MRYQQKEVHFPRWEWRIVVSTLVIMAAIVSLYGYGAVQGPMEAKTAVQQLQDNPEGYAIARTWAASDVTALVKYIAIGCLALVWVPFAVKAARYYVAQESLGNDN